MGTGVFEGGSVFVGATVHVGMGVNVRVGVRNGVTVRVTNRVGVFVGVFEGVRPDDPFCRVPLAIGVCVFDGVIVAEAVMVGVAEIRGVGVAVGVMVLVGTVAVGKGPRSALAVPTMAVLMLAALPPLPRLEAEMSRNVTAYTTKIMPMHRTACNRTCSETRFSFFTMTAS